MRATPGRPRSRSGTTGLRPASPARHRGSPTRTGGTTIRSTSGSQGTDDGSGIAECSPKVALQGPGRRIPAKLVGQCRDAAGHLSAPITVELRYDSDAARPPERRMGAQRRLDLARVDGRQGRRTGEGRPCSRPEGQEAGRRLTGKGAEARRQEGTIGAPGTGTRSSSYDQAGNVSTKTIGLKPAMGIDAPADGAIVGKPPVVAVVPVAEARFYNLQLWRGKLERLTTGSHTRNSRCPSAGSQGSASHSLVNGQYTLSSGPHSERRATPVRKASRAGRVRRQAAVSTSARAARPYWPNRTRVGESAHRRHKGHLVPRAARSLYRRRPWERECRSAGRARGGARGSTSSASCAMTASLVFEAGWTARALDLAERLLARRRDRRRGRSLPPAPVRRAGSARGTATCR